MFYAFLADVLQAIHFGFLVFTLVGQILILVGLACRWQWVRNPWFRSAHLVGILFVAFEYAIELDCPLTTWEVQLRQLAGQANAQGETNMEEVSFVGRCIHNLFFCPDLDTQHWAFGVGYGCFAAIVLATFIFAPPRRRRTAPPGVNETPAVAGA